MDDCRAMDIQTAISPGNEPTENVKTAVEPCERSSSSVMTAISECDFSSKDVETAREITDSIRQLCSSNDATGQCTGQPLLPFGVLEADAQRSFTEVHDARKVFDQAPHDFDSRAASSAKKLGVGPQPEQLAAVDGDVRTAAASPANEPTEGVKTAVEPREQSSSSVFTDVSQRSDTSSKDVNTAQEIDAQPFSSSSNFGTSDQTLLPFGTLEADAQRSFTEVHDAKQVFDQTPHDFDARASSSAKKLGVGPPPQQLASVDGDVKTAAASPANEPTENVKTAVEPCERSSVMTAISECDFSSKDVETAREITDSIRQLCSSTEQHLLPFGVLEPDAQRSFTEVHDTKRILSQTPHDFDIRAAISAQKLGVGPQPEQLASVDGDVKTAAASPANEPAEDVKTAVEPREQSSSVFTDVSQSDTSSKDVETAREISDCIPQHFASSSNFDVVEHTQPGVSPANEQSEDIKTGVEPSEDTLMLLQLIEALQIDNQCAVTETVDHQQLNQNPQVGPVEDDVKTGIEAGEESSVMTAISICDSSSHDVQTAKEITDSVRKLVSSNFDTSEQPELHPVGDVQSDAQKPVTPVECVVRAFNEPYELPSVYYFPM